MLTMLAEGVFPYMTNHKPDKGFSTLKPASFFTHGRLFEVVF
jgi:hypothetical protein